MIKFAPLKKHFNFLRRVNIVAERHVLFSRYLTKVWFDTVFITWNRRDQNPKLKSKELCRFIDFATEEAYVTSRKKF